MRPHNTDPSEPRPFQTQNLFDAKGLLEALWPNPQSRPSMRWLRKQQAVGALPYVKWGRRVFFDLEEVTRTIKRRTVNARPA